MIATMPHMATKPNSDRHKPSRQVRIPVAIANALQEIANEEFNSLPDQVLAACREYLMKRDRLPKPGKHK